MNESEDSIVPQEGDQTTSYRIRQGSQARFTPTFLIYERINDRCRLIEDAIATLYTDMKQIPCLLNKTKLMAVYGHLRSLYFIYRTIMFEKANNESDPLWYRDDFDTKFTKIKKDIFDFSILSITQREQLVYDIDDIYMHLLETGQQEGMGIFMKKSSTGSGIKGKLRR